jgi:hypothetical protein
MELIIPALFMTLTTACFLITLLQSKQPLLCIKHRAFVRIDTLHGVFIERYDLNEADIATGNSLWVLNTNSEVKIWYYSSSTYRTRDMGRDKKSEWT